MVWVTKACIFWLSYRCHKLALFMECLKSLWSCLRALKPLCCQSLLLNVYLEHQAILEVKYIQPSKATNLSST